jgi:short-subunit dehydrogenase
MGEIELKGKPIAITGASSGIGAATALACARAGMPVAISARRADKLEEVAARIREVGGRVLVSQVDVTSTADCQRFIEETIDAFGSVYAVYANAGYGLEVPVHAMTDRQMRDMFETNFFGTMNTIWPAVPHMVKAGAGHILICSSCLARMPIPYYGAYSATKAAQHHAGRAMRLELEPFGVHVSTVHPIGTKTEFFDQVKHRTGSAELIEHTPDTFMQTPSFVAACTVKCLRRPKAEVWTGVSGRFVRFGMSVTALLPRVGDVFVRGMVKRRMAQAERIAAAAEAARAPGA